ncbi:Ger(x)C family spore germination protein [Paenibacillus kobensis]|uniref:Ger(x)C family spore germination protein n=1 Tax=Paenibacillus kobensis TaxID=59841 RepID=UPI002482303E|nr:Ger(x)C family spore germination protein [Paenibacillus kobensis]
MLVVLMSAIITGCSGRTELNEISIVSASGIDWKDGKWIVSYQLVLPQAISSHGMGGGASGAAPINVFSTSGDSIRGAISKSSYEMSRRLYFSQNQIVVVSERAAKHGLTSLFDAYLRNPDSRETVNIFLTKHSARDILEHLIPLEEIPGAAIARMIVNEENNGSTLPNMTVYRALLELLGPTKSSGIPSLEISGTDPLDSTQKTAKTYSSSKIKLAELGLLQDDKMVGWLTRDQSYGVMWVRGQIKQSTVWFTCDDNHPGEKAVMKVHHMKTKRKAVKDGDNWKLDVRIKARGTLLEYPCEADLSKPASIAALERRAADKIALMANSGFKAVQEQKADIIGLGVAVRLQYPRQWDAIMKRWNEQIFPEAKIDTKVDVVIERTGMSTDSFRKMQKKAGGS